MRALTASRLAASALAFSLTAYAAPDSPIPAFEATSLTGTSVSGDLLVGQPTLLVITPSRAAAEDTRQWAEALRKRLDEKTVRIRAVLAVDLPFFMDESDAIGLAKEKIPPRFHDQTWILGSTKLEDALSIPSASSKAFVIVLNAEGQIIARVSGAPTELRIGQVLSAVRTMK